MKLTAESPALLLARMPYISNHSLGPLAYAKRVLHMPIAEAHTIYFSSLTSLLDLVIPTHIGSV